MATSARRIGRYTPLVSSYYEDDAIAEAGEAAELLYVRILAFCAGRDTDGAITRTQIQRFAGVGMVDALDRADQLVEVNLLERNGNGYRVRSWLKYNKSADEMSRGRAKDRARKAGTTSSQAVDDTTDTVPDGIRAESEGNPDGVQTEPARIPATTSLHSTSLHGSALHVSPRADPTPDSLLADLGATPDEREKLIPTLTKRHNIQGLGWWINAASNGTLAARLREARDGSTATEPPPARTGVPGRIPPDQQCQAHPHPAYTAKKCPRCLTKGMVA